MGIEIYIKLPNLMFPEVIYNPPENIGEKIKYYQNAYNEELQLKVNPDVAIVGYKITNKKMFKGENKI